jgi:hypothetical protein
VLHSRSIPFSWKALYASVMSLWSAQRHGPLHPGCDRSSVENLSRIILVVMSLKIDLANRNHETSF